MGRLELMQGITDEVLLGIQDPLQRREGYIHLYGVSSAAATLALRRDLKGISPS